MISTYCYPQQSVSSCPVRRIPHARPTPPRTAALQYDRAGRGHPRTCDAGAAQAAVAAGVLGEILLMVVLGIIEGRRRDDFGGDTAATGLLQSVLIGGERSLRRLHLLAVVRVYAGTVLSTDIIALAHALSRIVRLPEQCQQIPVVEHGGIVNHPHHFIVPSEAAAYLPISGVGGEAAGIADQAAVDARHLPEQALRTPEAAEADQGRCHAGRKRRYEAVPADIMRRRHGHGRSTARQGFGMRRKLNFTGTGHDRTPSARCCESSVNRLCYAIKI